MRMVWCSVEVLWTTAKDMRYSESTGMLWTFFFNREANQSQHHDKWLRALEPSFILPDRLHRLQDKIVTCYLSQTNSSFGCIPPTCPPSLPVMELKSPGASRSLVPSPHISGFFCPTPLNHSTLQATMVSPIHTSISCYNRELAPMLFHFFHLFIH